MTAVLARDPAGATLSVQAPEALTPAERTSPTDSPLFTVGVSRHLDDTRPGGLRGYADWVRLTRPYLIAIQNRLASSRLTPALAQDYRRVGRGPTFAWWAGTDPPRS